MLDESIFLGREKVACLSHSQKGSLEKEINLGEQFLEKVREPHP